jgi:multidrug resistance efflux pump
MSRNSLDRKPRSDSEGASEAPRRTSGDAEALGVREQIDLLRGTWQSEQDLSKPPAWVPVSAVTARRLIKSAVALALAVALGWMPLQRLYLTTSAEATVNARVITLRSPIEGRIVDWRQDSIIGAPLHSGETVLRIENPRADRSRLDELRGNLAVLADQRDASAERLIALESQRAEQLAQFENFSRHRIAHMEARRREIVADREAATARLEAAAASLDRTVALFDKGIQAPSTYDQAIREQKVTLASLAAIERRLEAADIELAAAREGVFVTDGFNDIPRSAQRASELGQLAADVKVTIAEQGRRLTNFRSQVEEEASRYQTISVAEMTSPTEGRVWEILTSPGEDIHRGQELMRILDCKGAVVTSAVSEASFNKLQIGGTATFRLRGESEGLPGRIIGLHGLASVPANFAVARALPCDHRSSGAGDGRKLSDRANRHRDV